MNLGGRQTRAVRRQLASRFDVLSAARAIGRGRSLAILQSTAGLGWSGGGLIALDPVEVVEIALDEGPPFLSDRYAPFEELAEAVRTHPELLWVGHLNYIQATGRERRSDLPPAIRFCGYRAWVELRRGGSLVVGEADAADRLSRELSTLGDKRADPERIRPRRNAGMTGRSASRSDYEDAVREAIEHIRAGDFYQVNIAHRLETEAQDGLAIAARLAAACPAPFAAYLDGGSYEICSASPELFLRLREGVATTRPIKGTRPRGGEAESDTRLAAELIASEKERAENLMIVDLERNDLGRVARPGSVKVPELWRVESYKTVHHLVSTVEAELADGVGLGGLLSATFPGGSITGAPKYAAMRFIDEVESVPRGPYTGAIGYIAPSPDGARGAAGGWGPERASCPDLELNVAIRTIVTTRAATYLWVGSGIVADSDPGAEYVETLDKAAGLAGSIGITLDE